MTGPSVGSSSVLRSTPAGVSTSIALGMVPGSAPQIVAVPPGAQTPNRNGCAVAAKPRAWSGLKPSCPVSTTANDHPDAGVPKADAGTPIVMVRATAEATTVAPPSERPAASSQTDAANPCTSSRSLQASAGAIV